MLNEKKIRDLYFDQIGTVAAERAAGTEEAPFVALELHAVAAARCAYATLGASKGPLGYDLVMDTTELFAPLGAALEAVARAAPALGPGVVVPHVTPGTPFTAFLCMPLEAKGGSFSLSKDGGPPFAFRLAPLTAAEQALAEREPGRATDLLRAACAVTADRYRPCLVDVPPPPPAARTEVALQRRQARAALLALQEDMRRAHGTRTPTLPPERGDNARIPPGWHAALVAWVERSILVALRPYVRHPAPVMIFFGELLYVMFATHPESVRMLDRALDPRNLPRPPARDDAREAEAASRRVTEALAIAIARFHPGEGEAALAARGLAVIPEALSSFDPDDEIPLENHVWAAVLPAMYEGLEDLKPPAVRGLPKVFRRVAENEVMLEHEPDPRPPLLRLREIAARMATELVTAYAAGLRGQLPG